MITSNANTLIKQLRQYKSDLKKKEERIVSELVEQGTNIAEANLNRAEYTGYMDAQITSEAKGKRGSVSLVGYQAGFIEFGTGVYYDRPDETHPLATEYGAIRGEWGKKRGKTPPWSYPGEPGTSGWSMPKSPGWSQTLGFPANRTMYNTGKELHQRLNDIVKDIFND